MAKKKNFFGIRKGKDPETGNEILNQVIDGNWDVAKHYVLGVAGAEYSGFATKEEAEEYVGLCEKVNNDEINRSNTAASHKIDTLYCYVDGSFNQDISNYGYGLVIVKNGQIVHFDKGEGKNKDAVEMRQIGGELLGAMKGLLYAKHNNESDVVIFHDYKGVGLHATGEWKPKKEFSKVYHQWMQNFFKEHPNIHVYFEKVDAHTGDDFNEIADGLAKLSVGLKPNAIFYKMVEKHKLKLDKEI